MRTVWLALFCLIGLATTVVLKIGMSPYARADVSRGLPFSKAEVSQILVNPSYPDAETQVKQAQDAALALGEELFVLKAINVGDFEPAFANLTEHRADALLV